MKLHSSPQTKGHINRLSLSKSFTKFRGLVFITIFAIIGITLLFNTRAATPFASLEPEQGSLSLPATQVNDGAASGGQAVQFVIRPPVVSDPCTTFPTLPSVKPLANNTGVPVGTSLSASGSISITTDGTVLDAKNISGTIDVKANNVTIKNSRIKSEGYYGIHIFSGFTGTKVLHSEVYASAPAGNYIGIFIDGINSIICGNYLHGFENAMTITNDGTIVQANFIEKLVYVTSPPPHYDGIEVYGGNNQKLWGNNILMTNPSGAWLDDTGAINPTAYGGTNIDNVEINGNWLGGGSNVLNLDQQDTSRLTNVKITNNRWYRSPGGVCRCYDPAPTIWSGNVWDDSGAVIAQP